MKTSLLLDYPRLCRFFHGDTPVSDTITLSRRNIYILPTREGLFFALVLTLMLIGSINYSNSLGFLLTFLLGSLGIVTILHTYKMLYQLKITMADIQPVFCGQELHIPLIINNLNGPARYALRFDFPNSDILGIHDLDADSHGHLTLKHKAQQRGVLKLERLRISSRYPLGIFLTWSVLNFTQTALIYPRPAGSNNKPTARPQAKQGEGSLGQGSDDFVGLRNYQAGDAIRHIHWKALAKEQGLLTKQFGGEDSLELMLDWRSLSPLDPESRLSCLTQWILEAQKSGVAYGLWIPGTEIIPASGDTHQHRCLRLLAEFGQNDPKQAGFKQHAN
ncbi:FIG002343: hypothetical protein [hydrothermal vent metagenome]|uniref:DUF58 domain-containing protein n=1 Tax=hydrothermal vent metagenome TaxID=652676 RepID=A0A3B1B240_9ZZZZ